MPHQIDAADLASLLRLELTEPGRFRSLSQEGNPNDRIYGGQVLAHLLLAASNGIEENRLPSALQMVFLQSATPEAAVDYQVDVLQEGGRFSSRHVSAHQGDRLIADGHVSFQRLASSVGHAVAAPATLPPEQGMRLGDLSGDLQQLLLRTYTDPAPHPFIDMRVVNVEAALSPTAAAKPFHIWVRISHRLPDSPRLHAAGLAYLSDWWLNFIGTAPHLKGSDGFYVVSLNHSTWFHTPCRADEWILCVNHSPNAGAQRALSLGEFFTQDGRHIATVAQQALLTNRMRS